MATHPKWCSVRLRFTAEELTLLKAAEAIHGDALGREPHAAALRDALALMKAVGRVVAANEGGSVTLGEADTAALHRAVQFTVRQLERYRDAIMGWHANAAMDAAQRMLIETSFPTARGSAWEISHIIRSLEALSGRLAAPLAEG